MTTKKTSKKKPKVRKILKPTKRGKLTSKQCRDAVKKVMAKRAKKDIVQVKDHDTGLYVKVDRSTGKIIAKKKTAGIYKGIKVTRKKIDGLDKY